MQPHPLREKVINSFINSWANARQENSAIAVDFLTSLYDRFRSEGLADPIFETQLTSGLPEKYCQRVAELLLAEMLWKDGFDLKSSSAGPDFHITKDGKSAWVELQTPQAMGIPSVYFERPGTKPVVRSVPYNAINLRWTSAISEKTRQLRKYLERGIVTADEPYIIAVNAHLLSPMAMTGLYGVSQKPAPVEVLFSLGPIQMEIDRNTGDIVDQSHQHRPRIDKPGSEHGVEADTFIDERNACVSAVLGLDLLEQIALNTEHHSALVYNPLATNPIVPRWITAQEHWSCKIDPDSFTVMRV
ncbi:hypothetical protein [Pseudomonas yamanorum]|uniref:hypothetical protein n=1 Tax=Pseudomonas yamanorum TaxID=515393 RepID=UPI003B9F2873